MSVDQLSAVPKSEQASAIATIAPGSEPDGEGIVKVLSESVSPEKRADWFAVLEQMDQHHPEYPHWLGVSRAMQGTGLRGVP